MLYPMRPIVPKILPVSPKGFWVQYKYNGWNIVIYNGQVYTRRGLFITDWRFWSGIDLNTKVPLQCELIVPHGVCTDVPRLKNNNAVGRIVVHDAMVDMEIEERRKMLKSIVPEEKPWCRAPFLKCHTWTEVNDMFDCALRKGHEGVVLKQRHSGYYVGSEKSAELPIWMKFRRKVLHVDQS